MSERTPAARTDSGRELNRGAVFDVIRRRQPVSRAELGRITGLQRRTIWRVTDELLREAWVVEVGHARSPDGRNPALLSLSDKRNAIAVAFEDSHLVFGAADLAGNFFRQEVVRIGPDPGCVLEAIVSGILRTVHLCHGRSIDGVGISLPVWRHQVASWGGRGEDVWQAASDIRNRVASATGLPVDLDTEANACIAASVLFDGLDECQRLAVVHVAEEIQVGFLSNGQLVHGPGSDGLGHVSLDPSGPACACGGRGCWTWLASNSAAIRQYSGPEAVAGGVSFSDLLSLSERGDACANAALQRMALYLGRGIRIVAAAFAPECILVTGKLAACWSRFGPVIGAELAADVGAAARPPRLIPRHDPLLPLRGAVAMVFLREFPTNRWRRGLSGLNAAPGERNHGRH